MNREDYFELIQGIIALFCLVALFVMAIIGIVGLFDKIIKLL